jgi:hypothetical protein
MPSLSKLDWPAILGNVIALWAGLLVLGTLAGRGAVWAMSHQAVQQAREVFR